MKIISRGVVPAERVQQFTCRQCETVAEVTQGECKILHDRDGISHYVACPVCFYVCWPRF